MVAARALLAARMRHCSRLAQDAHEAGARTDVSPGSCDADVLHRTFQEIVRCHVPWPARGLVRTQPAPVLQLMHARGGCPLPLAWLQGRHAGEHSS
jgi:hypothetical protein